MRITDEELELIREQQTKVAQIKQDIGTLELRKYSRFYRKTHRGQIQQYC